MPTAYTKTYQWCIQTGLQTILGLLSKFKLTLTTYKSRSSLAASNNAYQTLYYIQYSAESSQMIF